MSDSSPPRKPPAKKSSLSLSVNNLLHFGKNKPMSVSSPSLVSKSALQKSHQPIASSRDEALRNLALCTRRVLDEEYMYSAQLEVLLDDYLAPLSAPKTLHAAWPLVLKDIERLQTALRELAKVSSELIELLRAQLTGSSVSLARAFETLLATRFEVFGELRNVWAAVYKSFALETMSDAARELQEVSIVFVKCYFINIAFCFLSFSSLYVECEEELPSRRLFVSRARRSAFQASDRLRCGDTRRTADDRRASASRKGSAACRRSKHRRTRVACRRARRRARCCCYCCAARRRNERLDRHNDDDGEHRTLDDL